MARSSVSESRSPHRQRRHSHRHRANSIKASERSHSSSLADDERSSSSTNEDIMGPEASAFRDVPSQYEGEDTRLTSKKELAGWYAYGFAAEVFVISGIGTFSLSPVSFFYSLSSVHSRSGTTSGFSPLESMSYKVYGTRTAISIIL